MDARAAHPNKGGDHQMRKLLLAVALAGAVAAATATTAFAGVTFHAGPSFTDLGGGYTVNLFADASGLGKTMDRSPVPC